MARRLVVWQGSDALRWEVAELDLGARGMFASGTQVGIDAPAYRLDYELDATDGFVTGHLELRARGEGWSRTLVLNHDGRGEWDCSFAAEGVNDLEAGGPRTEDVLHA